MKVFRQGRRCKSAKDGSFPALHHPQQQQPHNTPTVSSSQNAVASPTRSGWFKSPLQRLQCRPRKAQARAETRAQDGPAPTVRNKAVVMIPEQHPSLSSERQTTATTTDVTTANVANVDVPVTDGFADGEPQPDATAVAANTSRDSSGPVDLDDESSSSSSTVDNPFLDETYSTLSRTTDPLEEDDDDNDDRIGIRPFRLGLLLQQSQSSPPPVPYDSLEERNSAAAAAAADWSFEDPQHLFPLVETTRPPPGPDQDVDWGPSSTKSVGSSVASSSRGQSSEPSFDPAAFTPQRLSRTHRVMQTEDPSSAVSFDPATFSPQRRRQESHPADTMIPTETEDPEEDPHETPVEPFQPPRMISSSRLAKLIEKFERQVELNDLEHSPPPTTTRSLPDAAYLQANSANPYQDAALRVTSDDDDDTATSLVLQVSTPDQDAPPPTTTPRGFFWRSKPVKPIPGLVDTSSSTQQEDDDEDDNDEQRDEEVGVPQKRVLQPPVIHARRYL